MNFAKKVKKSTTKRSATVVPSDNGQTRRTRQSTPAVQDPPPAKHSQPARATRSNTPAVADPPPLETSHSTSAVAMESARTLHTASTVLEPLEEEHEDPTTHVERKKALLSARKDNRNSQVNKEARTNLPSTRVNHNQAPDIPPTPLPHSGAYQTLFNEDALLEAEIAELEDDPYANDDEQEEDLVGFGQPRSPFIRSPFTRFSSPRPSNPPSTQASSDDEGQSHQAKRDAKGKGRAIIQDDLDDDELKDELEELEDDGTEDEPDEPSNAPGEKLPY
jgi:hypothetical protein